MAIPAHINRQCEDLTSLIGETCLPCVVDSENDALTAQMSSVYQAAFQQDAELITRVRERAFETGRIQCAAVGGDRTIFAIPLHHQGSQQWFALGRAWNSDAKHVAQLLRLAGEACKRQYLLEQQSATIETAEQNFRQSLQERNWIRELSSYTQDRSRTTANALTARVLSQLHTMIQADAVCVFPTDDDTAREILVRPLVAGSPMWKAEDFKKLLRLTGSPATGEFTLQNGTQIQLENGLCNAFVAVQVGSSLPLGYLVAINRRIDRKTPLRRVTDVNFTGADAAMLQEAATFFESEGIQRQIMGESERLIIGTLRAMSSAIEARDPYTRGHSERVARMSYELAKFAGISHEKCREIYISGVLHDIGKIGIPDHVLLKPGKLDPDELAIIQKHPTIGHHILSDIKKLEFALPGVLYHHERWDGKGYPHQLEADATPLMARVIAVADAFDAMTSSRPYRSAMEFNRARNIISEGAGEQFDPELAVTFLEWLGDRNSNGDAEDPMGILKVDLDFNADAIIQIV